MIEGNDSAASSASSKIRFVILIESEIPQHHGLRPVARRGNDQPHLLFEQISLLPVAPGTLRHPDFFFWEAFVQFQLSGSYSAITVGCRSRCIRGSLRVAHHLNRKFNQVPIMIEDENLGRKPSFP